jgi:hypothetical protein
MRTINEVLSPIARAAVDFAGSGAALPVEDLGQDLDGLVLVYERQSDVGRRNSK